MPDDIADESVSDKPVPERWLASPAHDGRWTDPADDPRTPYTDPVDEKSNLVEYLRVYRLTMELKCADLDADQLAMRSVPPSPMSLLGLIRHMADVERNWFRRVMAGQDAPPYYWSGKQDDQDWLGAVADPAMVAESWQRWRDEVAFAEQYVAGIDDMARPGTMRDGGTVALRDVLLHMVEEYARHCGHADLLRERIDGRVGQ